ncbi:mitochondrial inner membrane protease subunit 1-like [Calliopsis andreniformis]|uniref:mitochondrial inner membrane protease subunit 1-like n=1 Tax=Calliopsis andreniformis TaxID=337506 RepID=UPI003FCCF11F
MVTRVVCKFLSASVQCACIVHCVCEYIGSLVMCVGPSMEPTLYDNDVLITERISITLQKLKKGDIIISKCPSNPKQYICKRVVGLPGDKVKHGVIVPNGHVWLEGDNTNNSTDSRVYGPVPQGLLRGRAFCRILPLRDITFFDTEHSHPN